MLIQHPHNLGRVHGRAAAQGDDHIGLEAVNLLDALSGAGQGRVRGHVGKHGVLNAQLVQTVGQRLGVAVLIQEAVGDDERLFAGVLGLQLFQGHGHTALLKEYLLGRAEPQHVLSPLGHGLNIDQVLNAHVLGNGVAAPGAAAQGEGRGQLEVVQVADAAEGGGGVHHNAAGLHGRLVPGQTLLLGGMDIQRGGVAVAAVLNQALGLCHRVFKVLGLVHGQHGGELLVGELFRDVHALHLANENLGALGHGNPSQSGNLGGGLAHDLGVKSAVDDDGLAHLVQLGLGEDVAAALDELGLYRVIQGFQGDDGLLGGADHAVVEGFGVDDGVDGHDGVRALVDDGRHIARAHAQSRGAGGIGGLDHAGAAGGQDDVRLGHDQVGQLQGGRVDPAEEALRRAGLHGGLQHHLGGGDGALLGPGMGADDDAVAGLQGQKGLKDGGGSGVGGGNNRRDYADGFGDLPDAIGLVLFDDAAGLGVFVGVIDILGGIVVLNDLVLHHAHAGLFHRQLGQRDTLQVGGHGRRAENFVDLLLGKGSVFLLRFADPGQHFFKGLYIFHDFEICLHEIAHPLLFIWGGSRGYAPPLVLKRSFRWFESSAKDTAMFSFWTKIPLGTCKWALAKFHTASTPLSISWSHTAWACPPGTVIIPICTPTRRHRSGSLSMGRIFFPATSRPARLGSASNPAKMFSPYWGNPL